MTKLLERMREELVRRNYAANTIHSYLRIINDFQQYAEKPLTRVGPDDLRQYHVYLLEERKLAVRSVVQRVAAVRFLYCKTLKRRDMKEDLPYPRNYRRQLPVVLSPEEVGRLIDSARNLFHRALIMTLYSCGLRRTEAARLKVSDIATAQDLYRWTDAYFNGRVLQKATVEAAITPAANGRSVNTPARQGGYGFGWGIGRLRGMRAIFHTGGGEGYCGALYYFPEARFTVIILANAGAPLPTYDVGLTARTIAELYLHHELEPSDSPAVDTHVDPGTYDAFTGLYDMGSYGVMQVTRSGSHLYEQTTNHGRVELFPRDRSRFFEDRKVVDADVEFVRSAAAEVSHLVFSLDGDAFRAPRLPDPPRALLTSYAGKYRLSNGQTIEMVPEGNLLFVRVNGQPRMQLYPRSAKLFYLLEAKVTAEFLQEPNGSVNRLVLNQDGRSVEGRRLEAKATSDSAPAVPAGPGAPPPFQPEIKAAAPLQVVVIPMRGAYAQTGIALELLTAFLASRGVAPAGAPFGRYYDAAGTVPDAELRWEVGFPVAGPLVAGSPFEMRTLEDSNIAVVKVPGEHSATKPWPKLLEWIAEQGYRPAGPNMEFWLDGPRTELRIAVERAK